MTWGEGGGAQSPSINNSFTHSKIRVRSIDPVSNSAVSSYIITAAINSHFYFFKSSGSSFDASFGNVKGGEGGLGPRGDERR